MLSGLNPDAAEFSLPSKTIDHVVSGTLIDDGEVHYVQWVPNRNALLAIVGSKIYRELEEEAATVFATPLSQALQ